MGLLTHAKNRIMFASRKKKMDLFYGICSGQESILDVGVSAENRGGVAARNQFLKSFRFAPEQYTGLAIQSMDGMAQKFPGKKFIQYEGGKFPFDDLSFDLVFCNAVIEHVGDDEAQSMFLKEMLRVASTVFFTTPNKWFPIESHTLVPFLHWFDRPFYLWCRKFRPHFGPCTLRLLSHSRLEELLKEAGCESYRIFPSSSWGIPMTFSVICSQGRPVNSRIRGIIVSNPRHSSSSSQVAA